MSEDISSNQGEDLVKLLDKHVAELAEHFDGVQIFVNRNEGHHDKTRSVNRGSGNWFSRYGQIREWVIYEEQRIREQATKSERDV